MLAFEEQDIHIAINKNGTPLQVTQTEENKYDLYFWFRMQMYNNAYLWSFHGDPDNCLTWNAKLLMPSKEASLRQANTILKFLKYKTKMQNFVAEDYQTQIEYPLKSTPKVYQYTFPKLPKVVVKYNQGSLRLSEITRVVKQGMVCISGVSGTEKTYNLYLPRELDLFQKSSILELLLDRSITVNDIYLWQGEKFDLLTGHPLQNLNFSTDPKNTLTLKKPY